MARNTSNHPVGTVYILEFAQPIRHAKYYIGWTSRDPETRLNEHLRGRGCPLVYHAGQRGAVRIVALVPEVTREVERRLKNRKNTPRLVDQLRRNGQALY